MPTVEMYDSATDQIPAGATDILVYTDGIYANATILGERFPHATLHTISAVGKVPGRWIDVEPGCVWPPAAAVALQAEWAPQGCKGFYCNRFTQPLLVAAGAPVGVEWFLADPTGVEHVIPGTVATQWGWFSTYDVSLLEVNPYIPHPKPAPLPQTQEITMFVAVATGEMPAGQKTTIAAGDVYLVTEGRKYGLYEGADQTSLEAKLGPAVPVSSWLLQAMPGS